MPPTPKKKHLLPLTSDGKGLPMGTLHMGNLWGADKGRKNLFSTTPTQDYKTYQREYFRLKRSKNAPDPKRRKRNGLWGADADRKNIWKKEEK